MSDSQARLSRAKKSRRGVIPLTEKQLEYYLRNSDNDVADPDFGDSEWELESESTDASETHVLTYDDRELQTNKRIDEFVVEHINLIKGTMNLASGLPYFRNSNFKSQGQEIKNNINNQECTAKPDKKITDEERYKIKDSLNVSSRLLCESGDQQTVKEVDPTMSSMDRVLLLLVLVNLFLVCSSQNDEQRDYKTIQKIVNQCSSDPEKYSCLADKAAIIVEHLIPRNLTVFNGITLTKFKEIRKSRTPRKWDNGLNRFFSAIGNFLNTHKLTYDLSHDDAFEGRLYEGRKKGGKKGRDLYYVMWIIFGIFGITVPVVMNALMVMAAKALLASKMALLIAGSIAIKKLFEQNHEQAKFKVVTHNSNDEDLDRNINAGAYNYLRTV
ncbi:hypothetical protein RN001_008541 [Aquatica leii]|uniref:Uncharacterized protein n=1 Tax=Aquatica leii TaxID=1421715 RepID=A0AAN7SRE0_9COLE|nr:hypothetical protein RN001_008541 [Aquatica leii]